MGNQVPDYRIFWPQHAVPGAIAIVGDVSQVERLLSLEREAKRVVYSVRAIVSDHIPLSGSLAEVISARPRCAIELNENPLTIYLHSGGNAAVFFDFCADDEHRLEAIHVEVEAEEPLSAFQGARTVINELLDTLMRRVWLPLVIQRLELIDPNGTLLAYQLLLPFPAGLRIGPLGGIHQFSELSEMESLAREAICATSPYYRLLCAHRLYEGVNPVRQWLREAGKKFGVEAPLPRDIQVDQSLLEGLGFPAEARDGIRTVSHLHSSLTEMRNQVAHYLVTKGEPREPLHMSDGKSCLNFSIAGAALLHYGFLTIGQLSQYYIQHLQPHLRKGSILPLKEHRARFRLIVKRFPDKETQQGASGGAPQAACP